MVALTVYWALSALVPVERQRGSSPFEMKLTGESWGDGRGDSEDGEKGVGV